MSAPSDKLYAELPLAQLRVSKTNPRRRLDDAKLQELAASLREKGVLEPLLVRPLPGTLRPDSIFSDGTGKFEIVAGERRFKAAQLAKLATVPCIIRNYSDADALECQVVENDQRDDLHPLDRADGYQALLNTGKYSNVEDLAKKLGKSRRAVYQCLQLRKLDAKIQEKFLADPSITATHAALLARLQPADQARALHQFFTRNADPPSTRQLEGWIHQFVHLDLGAAAFPLDDAGAVKSSQLADGARACTECPKRSGASPDLFAEIKEPNICTDPACYHRKEHTFVKIQLAESYLVLGSGKKNARGKLPGREVPREMLSVGNFYGRKPKGLTGWSPAGKRSCKDTVEGVVVEDESHNSEHKVGQVLRACTNSRCRVHHPENTIPTRATAGKARAGGSKKSTAADLRKAEKQQLEQRIAAAVNQELLEAAPRPIAGMDWQLLFKAVLEVIENDGKHVPDLAENFKARWGVAWDVYTAGFAQKVFGKHPEKQRAAILSDLLRAAAMALPYDFEEYREEILARYRVNEKAIARKVTAAHAAEKKDIAALLRQAIKNTARVDDIKGACWCCGCTDAKPCVLASADENDGTPAVACAWVDKTKKLCSNPECIRKAAELPAG
jgi:ParB family chromosome partitioning protein